ncbi:MULTISPECIES: patatin family protein [unclassified Photobacterium]|uniref:patatin-like phospholipase family protein n=1 Tax=unclassified Photobacterium TaxID=2628852 RepID=UPI000D16E605|nr:MULTISPECIES: patatin family protein [unclassified Photobacterium]PSV27927.1 patatin family protein [Photobacterium sp. GB-56]PSV36301.1 patatin family protein [Photobacterium sp. GB-210]PSV42119.1 patatin family protein [Photobacterium sp. GB-36]PSV54467.1 patatin family protein [Photobacterium sp. GB-3]PSW74613.1 patatin family protein [Photobacterium sp. GB-50]
MSKRALVVEGGAMRGIFATGVLDAFIERSYNPFDFTIGVSAGSVVLMGYLCESYQRNYKVITEYARSKEFINYRRFVKGGNLIDIDWLWNTSISHLPLELHKYENRNVPLYATTTVVDTGEPNYVEVTRNNLNEVMTATCALPIIYRQFPQVDGIEMSDGGIADPIPVIEAYNKGARDITVILSHAQGLFAKNRQVPWLTRRLFRTNPVFGQEFLTKESRYNKALYFIHNPPKDCKITAIAPDKTFMIKRLTKDISKLDQGYQQGREAGLRLINNDLQFKP